MRKILTAIVVLFIAGIFGMSLWLHQPEIHKIDDSSPIVFFGDSLVYGTGTKQKEDTMPSLLSKKLDRPVLNKGIPGNTTRDGLERLEKDVLSIHPGLVLLLLGGNDYLQKIDEKETFTNLAQIIDRIHAQGSQVLLIGVRGGVLLDGYNENYARLAREKNVLLVTDILKDILMDPSLKADQIHPNDAGYVKMAERLLPVVQLYLHIK